MWFKSSFKIPAVAAISFCLICQTFSAVADILHVPGDFPTIQEAIDAAMDGDEVEVHPGTYNENINFLGKAIIVRSLNGAGETTIDAGGSGTVVTCNSAENADTILDGFTITGGNNSFGGGMINQSSSPTVTNCTFSGNTASCCGGGMLNCFESSPTVANCVFTENSAGSGGGMANVEFCNPTITNSKFSGNTVKDNGGGLYNSTSNPTVINCTFSGNSAGLGGGMSNHTLSDPEVINCTFTGNSANVNGGGMNNSFLSDPSVTNCILWGNAPNEMSNDSSIPLVSYSNLEGGLPAGAVDVGGNIDADPLFVDPDNGDYQLSPGSPCIDAADNTALPKGIETDLDRSSRFVDDLGTPNTGNTDCINPIVDIGAYEFLPFPSPPADLDGDGFVNTIDLLMLLASWGDCPVLPEQCSADLNYDCIVGTDDLLALLAGWG